MFFDSNLKMSLSIYEIAVYYVISNQDDKTVETMTTKLIGKKVILMTNSPMDF